VFFTLLSFRADRGALGTGKGFIGLYGGIEILSFLLSLISTHGIANFCPIKGKILDIFPKTIDTGTTIMASNEFQHYICNTFNLSERSFNHLMDEFLGHFSSPLKDFVRKRHTELQRKGRKNEEIYRLIAEEVQSRRFAAENLTVRKIRRIIYG
jgi:hypothetical protein